METNKSINLTGIKEPREAIIKHTLDSVSASAAIKGELIADVGSGGGTPGIPLAIANPDKAFVLVESTTKKANFIRSATSKLEINNIKVICDRAENITNQNIDTVISRAYGSLNYLIETTKKMVVQKGLFLAMKGKINKKEANEIMSGFTVLQIQEIEVPYLEASRHFVFIKRT